MKSEEGSCCGLSLDLGLEDPRGGVDETERRGKRSPATEIAFEFAPGREETAAAAEFEVEVEVEVEGASVLALGIPGRKEKQGLAPNEKKKERKKVQRKPNRSIESICTCWGLE